MYSIHFFAKTVIFPCFDLRKTGYHRALRIQIFFCKKKPSGIFPLIHKITLCKPWIILRVLFSVWRTFLYRRLNFFDMPFCKLLFFKEIKMVVALFKCEFYICKVFFFVSIKCYFQSGFQHNNSLILFYSREKCRRILFLL